jgi:LysM repeat protein
MNTKNPFQIPSCFAELQQRRQQRFKRTVVGLGAAFAVLLVALLIEGCMTEHAKTTTAANAADAPPEVLPVKVATIQPKPVLTLQSNPVTPAPAASAALKTVTPPAISGPETLYVVKPGDTLIRIAKIYRMTVKSLKSVNGLSGDTIVVGTKLKLPTA